MSNASGHGRPINQDRQLAASLGFRTYHGSTHAACGTSERYTKSAGCVHCAKLNGREAREARDFLRKASKEALDKSVAVVTEPSPADDAAERFQQDIEDLM